MSKRKQRDRSTPGSTADRSEGKRPRSRNSRSRIDPDRRIDAEKRSLEGLKERTEEGHLLAGRTPPSQGATPRTSGAHRSVDTSIRDAVVLTEDAKLLQQPGPSQVDFTKTDPWRVLRIMGEFIEGFDVLASVQKGVSFFGSARTGPDDPMYQAAQETARLLARAGYDIITGAGPGVMEAANKGAKLGGGRSIG
jgi:hypothetical protein